jgi:tRNA(Ile)-lysidine synthase
VSGGGDSIALLRILHQLAGPLDLHLVVAHLNHGVRGAEADADASFVGDLARGLGIPCVIGSWRPDRAGHFESDARRARYRWLTETAQAHGANVVAVAHTRDDQAETILHRIVRGTGPRGLTGIPAERLLADDPAVTLVRPLLGVSRRQLRAYLKSLDQSFREDSSNGDLSRTRARIRTDLLPKLAAEYNPKVANALLRLGVLASSLERALGFELDNYEHRLVVSLTRDRIALKADLLRTMRRFPRVEVLRRLWRRAGWPERSMSMARWLRLVELIEIDQPTRIEVGAGVAVSADGSLVVLERHSVSPPLDQSVAEALPEIGVAIPGRTPVFWARGELDAQLGLAADSSFDETVDLDRLVLPLRVRSPRPGDRFEPLGMRGRGMALADFFRGRKVARAERSCIPLVCDRTGIIWVVGHRIADRASVGSTTSRHLRLAWRTCDVPADQAT